MPPEAAFESDSDLQYDAEAETDVEFESQAQEIDLPAATVSENGILPTPDDYESVGSPCEIHIDNNDSNTHYEIDLDDITAMLGDDDDDQEAVGSGHSAPDSQVDNRPAENIGIKFFPIVPTANPGNLFRGREATTRRHANSEDP